MRIIDADALIGRSVPLEGLDGSGIPYVVRAVPVMFIDDTPTLDYKDLVPQSEWEFVRADENDMPIYRCTNCKTKRYGKPPFCPQCGARMTK